ncbi:hypothetical protein ZWY2020_018102 [Hordeum vulgare]|nr:hypothetical protein ZWY2020_018102 [Hordeum vulgare]
MDRARRPGRETPNPKEHRNPKPLAPSSRRRRRRRPPPGADVARYCWTQFHDDLAKDGDYANNPQNAMINVYSSIDAKLKQSDDWRIIAYPPGISNLIRRLIIGGCTIKRWLWKEPYLGPLQEGCTACTVLINGNRIIVGNIGDSRCVLSLHPEAQENLKVLDLSRPHEPAAELEKERILKAGGQVWDEAVGSKLGIQCVEGTLPTSRSFGDFLFKQNKYLSRGEQMVISIPPIFDENITNSMEFIVLASSGIWSVKSSTQVIEAVREGWQSGKELKSICEELLDSCLAQGSKLNLSVIVVVFNPYQPPPLVQDSTHGGNGIVVESNPNPPAPMVPNPDIQEVNGQTSDGRQSVETAVVTDNTDKALGQEKKKGLRCFSVDSRRSGTGKSPRRHVKPLSRVLGLLKNGNCASTSATQTTQSTDASDLV